MKVPFTLGVVGHFSLAVRDPKKSARWFQRVLGLRKEFEFENGIAVGKKHKVEIEDPGDEIGPESPGSPHIGLWFRDPDGYRWELSVQGGR
jgi:catechol 2,3-dioxygenase-like lactoylglutathione lyase family enzyme